MKERSIKLLDRLGELKSSDYKESLSQLADYIIARNY